MSIAKNYPTPLHFYADLQNAGTTANTILEDAIQQVSPLAKPFASGAEMWKSKYAVDSKMAGFKQKYSVVSAWSAATEDEAASLIDVLSTYYARYRASSPAVQQAPRVSPPPPPIRSTSKPTHQAASSTRPTRSGGLGLVLFLVVGAIYWAGKGGK